MEKQAKLHSEIGKILQQARTDAGLSVRGLAGLAGISTSAVYNLEHSKGALGPVTLQKLSSALSLSPEQRAQLAELAGLTSTRMKTAPQISSAATDWDQFCLAMLRFTCCETGVNEDLFFQGFGVNSGIWVKNYDLLIRLRDQTWLGFVINPGEIRFARTADDDPKSLPKPDCVDFKKAGGNIVLLIPAEIPG